MQNLVDAIVAYEEKIDGEWGCVHSSRELAAGVDGDPLKWPALAALAEMVGEEAVRTALAEAAA